MTNFASRRGVEYGDGRAGTLGVCMFTGHIVQRPYLGEHWDYLVRRRAARASFA